MKFFDKLKEKISATSAGGEEGVYDLPSYLGHVAIYKDRLRVSKWAVFGTLAVCLTLIALQEVRVSKLASAIAEKDYLIVPGAPEFMRIRPGFIAPESVYLFAEYVASQLSTFSYNTADGQFHAVAEYMTPELKTRFLLSRGKSLKMFQDLRVDQVFDLEPVKTFDLKNDERGPKYIVNVRGQTRQYVEGSLRKTVPLETLTFVFRPRKIKPNIPWFFEIESFVRLTADEESKMNALESINQSEQK